MRSYKIAHGAEREEKEAAVASLKGRRGSSRSEAVRRVKGGGGRPTSWIGTTDSFDLRRH